MEEEKLSEQKISLKGDSDGKYGIGSKSFECLFHCWYYKPVVIFSLYLLYHAYHVSFQLVENISSLDVTVVLLMYTKKKSVTILIETSKQLGSNISNDWGETKDRLNF